MNIAFTSTIWHIWCEQNSRIFKGVELPVHVRNMLISQDCKHLLQSIVDLKKINRELALILSNFGIKIDLIMEIHPP